MPIADWTVQFELTSAVYDSDPLPLNYDILFPSGVGRYVLRQEGCKLRTDIRATRLPVPQEDGWLTRTRRFVTGCEMDLVVSFWEGGADPPERPACDDLLQEMVDTFMGYAYGLLNAGDNEGRISWSPSGSGDRMLDDIRSWRYPVESKDGGQAFELTFTVDCGLPYAEDLTQDSTSLSGGGGTVPNDGNRPSYPVWKIYGPFDGFTLDDGTDQFVYDGTLTGAVAVGASDYLEINTFKNTVYLNGSGANRMPGIVMTTSKFFLIPPGGSTIAISYVSGNPVNNNSSVALTNNAWA